MIRFLLDLLFPPRCILCHKFLPNSKTEVCETCAKAVLLRKPVLRQGSHFPLCVSAFEYGETLRESIHRFKFGGRGFYAETYGPWLAAAVRQALSEPFDLITWVPVSKKRMRKRGYDQAELLCKAAGKALEIPVQPCLVKVKDNAVQSRIHDRDLRRKNVSGVYAPVAATELQNKSILLVDDIITTGATLEECAKVLRQAGARRIVCATLAARN